MCGDTSRPNYEEGLQPIIDVDSSMVAAWAAIICSVLGVFGNIMTVTVFMLKRTLRLHSTTPFIMSLALSDLWFCAYNLPLTAVRFFNRKWIYGFYTCELFPFFFYANISISACSMAFVALNRFVGIFYPMKMKCIFNCKNSTFMVLGLWTFSMGLMVLPLTEVWGQLGYEPAIFSCTILPKNGSSPMSFLLITGFVLPCLCIILCYGLIYWRVRSTGDRMRSAIGSEEPQLRKNSVTSHLRRREQQLTKTAVLMCLGFIICFLPSSILGAFDPMPPCRNHPQLHVAGYIIFWCSGFVNPFIYVLSNRHYRQAVIQTLCPKIWAPEETSSSYPSTPIKLSMRRKRSNDTPHLNMEELAGINN